MRLTKAMREQFVEAVEKHLPDIPDFDNQTQCDEPVRKAAEGVLPKEVRDFAKKYPRYVDRGFSSRQVLYLTTSDRDLFRGRRPNELSTRYIDADPSEPGLAAAQKAAVKAATEKVAADFKAWKERRIERNRLLDRLREVAYAATTDKALKELLPEFAHLVPESSGLSVDRSLPVAAASAVVADLVKAGLKMPQKKAA